MTDTKNPQRTWDDSFVLQKQGNWQGIIDGVDYNAKSPTHDNETLGQTICRLGDLVSLESSQFGAAQSHTAREAQDLCNVLPAARTWFTRAMLYGREQHTLVLTQTGMDIFESGGVIPTIAPLGDVNPRYQVTPSSDMVTGFSAGAPQVGHVSSTIYPPATNPEDDSKR